jgi:protein gp37
MRHIRDACAAQGVAFFLKQDMRDGRLVSLPELDGVRHMAFPGS